MMNSLRASILLMSALVVFFGNTQAQLTIKGEVNARPEFRNGFKDIMDADADPAFFTEQRTRLYTNYKSENYEMQITLQDVRFWGANGQIHKIDNNMFGIAEGWGRYYIDSTFSIKAGRQMISYDNQRFFGGLEWTMQGRRHDALLLMYEKPSLKVHLGAAFNQSPSNGIEPIRLTGTSYLPGAKGAYHATGNYKDMVYAYINKEYDAGSLSIYLVNEGRQYGSTQDSTSARQTAGLMAMRKLGDVKLNGEYFYQAGKIETTDLSAYMFSLSATYKTSVTPITLGYDYLSGTDPNGTTAGAWAPAFGTNHLFYGYMDYFYVGNGHSNAGLQDIFLKTKFKVAKGALLGHVHYFSTAVDVIDPTDGSTASAGLGTEIDLVYVKKLDKDVTWKLGYSQMLATETMELVKGGGDADAFNNWVWTQLIIKPTLFKD